MFFKKVEKGYIRVYYKENSKKRLYNFDEIVKFFGLEEDRERKSSYEELDLENLLTECTTSLEKVRVRRLWHRAEKRKSEYLKLEESYIDVLSVNKHIEIIETAMKKGVKNIIPKIETILRKNNFSNFSFMPKIKKAIKDALRESVGLDYKQIRKIERDRYS